MRVWVYGSWQCNKAVALTLRQMQFHVSVLRILEKANFYSEWEGHHVEVIYFYQQWQNSN